MKYILFESSPDFPVVFPDFMDHSMMVRAIQSESPGAKPISAGFCNTRGSVWGKSTSLQLESQSEDARFLVCLFHLQQEYL